MHRRYYTRIVHQYADECAILDRCLERIVSNNTRTWKYEMRKHSIHDDCEQNVELEVNHNFKCIWITSYGFSPVCTRLWISRLYARVKPFPHWSQVCKMQQKIQENMFQLTETNWTYSMTMNDDHWALTCLLSLVWYRSCVFKSVLRGNARVQNLHLNAEIK